MNKKLALLFIPTLLLSCIGCNKKSTIDLSKIREEIQKSYLYFTYTTNYEEGSAGYGLTQDRLANSELSSIAATGFLLGCYPVFVEEGLISKEEAKTKVDKTFDTILNMQADSSTTYSGCLSHFVNKYTAKRYDTNVEISTIDTAILVSGVITSAQYFEDQDLINKGNTIWGNVDFKNFSVTRGSKKYISMGTNKPVDGTQLYPWQDYAEQLMIYILGAGNPVTSHRISSVYYNDINKPEGTFDGITHIRSWEGTAFTYQYSHAFYNFKMYNDKNDINWYDNSVNAAKTAYRYCRSLASTYKTFDSPAWGLTACDTFDGYTGKLGAQPRGSEPTNTDYLRIKGTIAPTGALGMMPFLPQESYDALAYYQTLPSLSNRGFGLQDAYNLEHIDKTGYKLAWYDSDIIGIDKGIAVMQMYNYMNTDFVSNLAMKNPYVIEGFINNEFVEVK